ncbi:MAG: prepilin-type N-terminal cleavage/methylation domain-containing protein [Pirellulales bacterium]
MKRPPRGFTLFEVILAMALSAIVLLLVSMAIKVHLGATDTRRTQIEEAQLARAVLQRIADDLRSTVQYKPIDFSSVSSLGGLDDLEADDLEGFAEGDIGDLTGDESEFGDQEPAGEVADIAGQAAPRSVPGLYGNRYELQLDVSRLPRLDEYDLVIRGDSEQGAVDLPSDIKSVAYYVVGGSASTTAESGNGIRGDASPAQLGAFNPNEQPTETAGLVRRSLDRAVTQYAIETGDLDRINSAGELLAAEVIAIEFRYSDGVEWFEEWNTEQRGSLPLTVQVAVAIDMHSKQRADLPGYTTSMLSDEAADLPQAVVYRLLVHLPLAEPPSEELLLDDEVFP